LFLDFSKPLLLFDSQLVFDIFVCHFNLSLWFGLGIF
jgi:hypothetical protein